MQLWTAIVLGFLGSFHCVGMCGPIAMSIPRNSRRFSTLSFHALSYNFGRVVTYTFLGVLFGLIGTQITIAGFQSWLSILLGVSIIAGVLISRYYGSVGAVPGINRLIQRSYGTLMRSDSPFKLPALGILNGFLPCAFVYTGLAAAVLTPTVLHSSAYMFFFGLGTIPAMYMMYMAPSILSLDMRGRINKMIPYLAVFLGAFLIVRGLALQNLALSEVLHSGMNGFCLFPGTSEITN